MHKIKNLFEMIHHNMNESSKGVTYIKDEDVEIFIPYSLLYSKSIDILHYLQLKGIRPGQEMVFQIDEIDKFLYIFWACIMGNIIPVPVTVGNNDEHKIKLFKIWEMLKSPKLICHKSPFEKLKWFSYKNKEYSELFRQMQDNKIMLEEYKYSGQEGNIYKPSEDDVAVVQFSSGSTGDPKGVTLTHRNIVTNILVMYEEWQFSSEDVTLSWMPLTHDMGLIGVHLMSMIVGIQQYIMPAKLFISKPVLWIAKADEHRVTGLYSPNFGYKYFLSFFIQDMDYRWDLTNIRYITNGAEPISVELCNEFTDALEKYGLKETAMKAIYGLAEASAAVTLTPVEEKFSSIILNRKFLDVGQRVRITDINEISSVVFADVGKPVKKCYVRICDNDGNLLNDYFIGNVQIKGENVTRGYYNNETATQEGITEDGWLNTGDLGFFREGRLVITGRAKDIIFIRGQNYYPHDIERVVENFPGCRIWQSAACGVFDKEDQTEKVVLFVVFKRRLAEFIEVIIPLQIHILENAGLKVDHIIPVRKIPKTTSGKVQRYKLTENFQNGQFLGLMKDIKKELGQLRYQNDKEKNLKPIERTLLDIYTKVFRIDGMGINDICSNCGGNSILLAQISEEIEKYYPGKVTLSDLFAYPTIKELANFISKNKDVEIPVLRMPEDYFNFSKEMEITSAFQVIFDKKFHGQLLKIAKSIDIEVNTILLSMFFFLLKEVSGVNLVPVQVLYKERMVNSIEVNFNEIEDFQFLFKWLESKYSNIPAYSINDVYSIKNQKDKYSIIPLFYRKGVGDISIGLTKIYDIVFELNEKENSIEIVCEYNNRRLKGDKVNKFINLYYNVVYQLIHKISKYEFLNR